MQLEKQVCSLEFAKKLKELGVDQESIWFWARQPAISGDWTIHYFGNVRGERHKFSAFTVAELGEMLPDGYKTSRQNKNWITYAAFGGADISADTEADARAKMLVYLIENGLYVTDQKSVA
jgi:hypothetical protein